MLKERIYFKIVTYLIWKKIKVNSTLQFLLVYLFTILSLIILILTILTMIEI